MRKGEVASVPVKRKRGRDDDDSSSDSDEDEDATQPGIEGEDSELDDSEID